MAKIGRARIPQVLRLRLLGLTPTKIANTMSVSVTTIMMTLADPTFKADLARHNEEAARSLLTMRSEMQTVAASVFLEVASDPTAQPKDRIAAARELADRFGLTRETTTRIIGADTVAVRLDTPSPGRIADNLTNRDPVA